MLALKSCYQQVFVDIFVLIHVLLVEKNVNLF